MTLEGKVAFVTGAASGMGRLLARNMANAGARIAAIDLDEAGLAKTAEGAHGIEPFSCDVTNSGALEAVAKQVETEIGPIDRVFAAAARQHRAEAHDQGSAGGGSKEGAAADSRCLFWHCHDYALPPFAAFFIAFFIRGYAMQRHRLPFMAWLMSSSLGFELFASRLAACMICPDWQ